MTREYHGFTCWFEADVRSLKLNPFTTETVFGTPVIVGVGNTFEERDRFEAALEEIKHRWGHLADIEQFCQDVLDDKWQPNEAEVVE